MGIDQTTRYSALAAAVALVVALGPAARLVATQAGTPPARPANRAPRPIDRTPLSLFPVRQLWQESLNSALAERPAYEGAHGYFPVDGNRLTAFDLLAKKELWSVSTAVGSPVVAGDGLLFFVDAGNLLALHTADGSLAWTLPFAETLAAPLTWNSGWLVAATNTGTVLAFRAGDGQLIWQRSLGAAAQARPALAADRMYIPLHDGRLVSLHVATGEPVWDRRLAGTPGEVLPVDDRLYVGTTNRYLYCLRIDDGSEDWQWRIGADIVGLPIADERYVYVTSLDNVLRALDRRSGNQRWKAALPLRPTAGPIRAGDVVIVTGLAASARAYFARDGKAAGELAAGGEMAAAPHVVVDPRTQLTNVILLASDVAKGIILTSVARSLEPPIVPVAPLPNAITIPVVRPAAPR